MKKIGMLLTMLAVMGISGFASADDDFWNTENCVASKWKDEAGNTLTIDDKFGPGSMAITRCLKKTESVKIAYQLNKECKNSKCDAPYAAGNIINHINDLEITHGMSPSDYKIVVVVHSGGWKLILDNNATEKHASDNPFQAKMEELIGKPSVKVLFCQNTANSKKVVTANMLKGVGYVTAGVSALSDLQSAGYRYVQP